jgi:hypothetical protein
MHRREFITLISGAAAAWLIALRAQQAKVYRVGVLLLGNADAESFQTAMREGLGKSGYTEGQNCGLSSDHQTCKKLPSDFSVRDWLLVRGELRDKQRQRYWTCVAFTRSSHSTFTAFEPH